MFGYDFWKYAYDAGWATADQIREACDLGGITPAERDQILGIEVDPEPLPEEPIDPEEPTEPEQPEADGESPAGVEENAG